MMIQCTSNDQKSNEENVLEVTADTIIFNNECDCKKYATEHKIELPNTDDLFFLSDSIGLSDWQFTEYRKVKTNVDNIRSKYDEPFNNCVKKFGDLDIIDAPCTKEEKTLSAFQTAISLIKRNCRGSNQELAKYMATKVNGVVVFMFMSVAQNGMVCISAISEINPNEILGADCGETYAKMAEWDALPEYKINTKISENEKKSILKHQDLVEPAKPTFENDGMVEE